jgi:hypothetical protein
MHKLKTHSLIGKFINFVSRRLRILNRPIIAKQVADLFIQLCNDTNSRMVYDFSALNS